VNVDDVIENAVTERYNAAANVSLVCAYERRPDSHFKSGGSHT
jgi:hypothetical protein